MLSTLEKECSENMVVGSCELLCVLGTLFKFTFLNINTEGS